MIYSFVESPASIDSIAGSSAFLLHQALERVEGNIKELADEEKQMIETVFSELWHPETYTSGKARIFGYLVDFTPFLKTYWISTKYYGIREVRAVNKEYVRKCATTPSHIFKIVEVG